MLVLKLSDKERNIYVFIYLISFDILSFDKIQMHVLRIILDFKIEKKIQNLIIIKHSYKKWEVIKQSTFLFQKKISYIEILVCI